MRLGPSATIHESLSIRRPSARAFSFCPTNCPALSWQLGSSSAILAGACKPLQIRVLRHRNYWFSSSSLAAHTLAAAGMEIGSHTLSHPMLSRASQQTAFEEISESRCLLGEVIQKPVWAFAYPFGDPDSVTAREIDMAQSAGYRCAVLNCETSSASRFAMSRLHMTADMSVPEIQAHLSGFHAALHRFARVEPTPVGKGA